MGEYPWKIQHRIDRQTTARGFAVVRTKLIKSKRIEREKALADYNEKRKTRSWWLGN
jgi:hypothetical protein